MKTKTNPSDVLLILNIVFVFTLIIMILFINHNNRINTQNNVWRDYSIAADAVIDLLEESDKDYFYDYIMETKEWDTYYYYRYESHIK